MTVTNETNHKKDSDYQKICADVKDTTGTGDTAEENVLYARY
jgi:hypothetical protein